MAAQRQPFATPEQYLEQDRNAAFKSEYMGGEIVAMSGASYAHVMIVANLVRHLGNGLAGSRCRALSNDLRVQIERTGAYVYPDVVIVCDEPRFLDREQATLLNPVVVFEVLSHSTADYDYTTRWKHYRRLDSIKQYVLAWENKPLVEVYTRHEDVWIYAEITDPEARLDLPAVGASLEMTGIYDGVTLPAGSSGP